jgi:Tol biopolymer transport system component
VFGRCGASVLTTLAAALAAAPAPAAATPPGRDGAIAFGRFAGGARDGLYRVGHAGGPVRRIVAGSVFGAGWAPGGARLAVVRRPVGGDRYALYTVGPEGGHQRRLTRGDDDAQIAGLSWSGNGRRIAFTRSGGTDEAFQSAIWVVRRDGRGLRRLTPRAERARDPSWSPTGGAIAYVSRGRLRVMRPDGTRRRTLPTGHASLGDVDALDWSPDGREIVFGRTATAAEPRMLYALDVAAGALRRIEPRGVPAATQPTWSPSGRRIAFVVPSGSRRGIHVCAADGTGTRRIARGARLHRPIWQPRH